MGNPISYNDLPQEVKSIAAECLGQGVLRSLFSYRNDYHLILKISDGVLVGFAIYHFRDSNIKDNGNFTVGVLDCVCVGTAYRNEGFGTLLTINALRKMSHCDRVEVMLKVPSSEDEPTLPGIPLIGSAQMLESLGFHRVKEFPNYYKSRSSRIEYDCAICGQQPDACSAVLFCIDSVS